MKTKFIDINDKKIAFYDQGQGEPLVIVHGWLVTKEIYQDLAEKLQDRYRVIVPDLPGFGESECCLEKYSLSCLADFLKEFIGYLGLAKSNFFGNSMGGTLVLELLKKYPQIVEKAVVRAGLVSSEQLSWLFTRKKFKQFISRTTQNEKNFKFYKPFLKLVLKKTLMPKGKRESKIFFDTKRVLDLTEKARSMNNIDLSIASDLGLDLLEVDYSSVLEDARDNLLYISCSKDRLVKRNKTVRLLQDKGIVMQTVCSRHSINVSDTVELSTMINNYIQ